MTPRSGVGDTAFGEFQMTLRQIFYALALLGVLGLAPALSACNTLAGAGEDMSAAGHAVTGTADKTKQGM
jgi:predicted small secreted protein